MVPVGSAMPWGSDSDATCNVPIPTDANFDISAKPASNAYFLNVTSLVNLTATRNLVVPNNKGNVYVVKNGSSGAQSIQVIGSSGTGITIATAKTAMVAFDGTNWVRLTADV